MSSRHTELILSFTASDVKRMQQTAAAALPEGVTVISKAVTERMHWVHNMPFEEIAAAGVSGMGEKEGIITNRAGLFFGDGYSGKLSGKLHAGDVTADGEIITAEEEKRAPMVGLSGFAGNNFTCLFRALCGGICSKCFSLLTPWRPSIRAWTRNDVILSSGRLQHGDVILDPALIPFGRFSSHGDLINADHAYNYLTIASDNPDTEFALWTKNAGIMREGFQLFGLPKPENLTLIYSPLRMNVTPSASSLEAMKAAGYDAVFSVFDNLAGQAAAVNAGAHFCKCGDGSCRHLCQFCYHAPRRAAFDPARAVLIAEILDGSDHKE